MLRHYLVFFALLAPTAGAQPTAQPQARDEAGSDSLSAAEFPERFPAARARILTAQVLLDRANFAPGVLDGQTGGNMNLAVRAFQAANGLPETGKIDHALVERLGAGAAPVLARYRITPKDVAGPFKPVAEPPVYADLAQRDALGFGSPLEALAERFHADEALLKALNPAADLSAAGTEILVPAVGRQALPRKVARVEVDKARNQLRALDAGGVLLAVYPATIGSDELPSPSGTWKVRAVATKPTYSYDPARLTKSTQGKEKLVLPAGPNNPVGSTWIDLTKDTYGIHGTPHPRLVGKRQSSGCVRLTNWDAWQLGQSVEAGTVVTFVG